jgi:4-hydroxy-tetrahydrodipicolinate reductase
VSRLRIAIVGATGRMGRALVPLLAGDPSVELVGAVTTANDPLLGEDAGAAVGIPPVGTRISAELTEPPDVMIEFSLPAGCAAWASWCAARSVPLVSGTTGLDAHQREQLENAARRVPVVWAANMSTGINLLLSIVRELAQRLDASWNVEICETHHRQKIDAPSGTAKALLDAICEARDLAPEDAVTYGRYGTPGARTVNEIGVHSLRMGAFVGEHTVHFATDHECLTLTQRTFSRTTFAAGALLAARWVVGRPAGLYGMREVLGL